MIHNLHRSESGRTHSCNNTLHRLLHTLGDRVPHVLERNGSSREAGQIQCIDRESHHLVLTDAIPVLGQEGSLVSHLFESVAVNKVVSALLGAPEIFVGTDEQVVVDPIGTALRVVRGTAAHQKGELDITLLVTLWIGELGFQPLSVTRTSEGIPSAVDEGNGRIFVEVVVHHGHDDVLELSVGCLGNFEGLFCHPFVIVVLQHDPVGDSVLFDLFCGRNVEDFRMFWVPRKVRFDKLEFVQKSRVSGLS